MDSEPRKEALQEEELEEVTGGNGSQWIVDRTIPDSFTPVEVSDGEVAGSALCPYCGKTLDFEMCAPYFADWAFSCKTCDKYFIKRSDLGWFQGPRQ